VVTVSIVPFVPVELTWRVRGVVGKIINKIVTMMLAVSDFLILSFRPSTLLTLQVIKGWVNSRS